MLGVVGVNSHAKLPHRQLARVRGDLASRQLPVADHEPISVLVDSISMLLHELRDPGIDGRLEHALGSLADDLIERRLVGDLPCELDRDSSRILDLWKPSFGSWTLGLLDSCGSVSPLPSMGR